MTLKFFGLRNQTDRVVIYTCAGKKTKTSVGFYICERRGNFWLGCSVIGYIVWILEERCRSYLSLISADREG